MRRRCARPTPHCSSRDQASQADSKRAIHFHAHDLAQLRSQRLAGQPVTSRRRHRGVSARLMADTIRQLASREVYRTPWMSVREDAVEFPDGTSGTYSVVDKDDFVVVLPYAYGGFWLVQQYRYPIGRREWEFPQGGWSTGRTGRAEQLAA